MNHFYSNIKLMLIALFAFMGMSAWADEVTDVLNQEFTGVSGTTYTDFSGKEASSTAIYAGQCAGGNSSIQLRSNNSNSGVITTASGGTLKKIVVTWNESTAAARVLNIYGSNTAYSAATDLYDSTNQGTLIGSLKCEDATNGVSTLEVTDDYKYLGFRSNSGALYLTSVAITWESTAVSVAKPTLTASQSFVGSMTVEMSAADGLAIYYTTDGSDPTVSSTPYTDPLEISATTTVKAIAVQPTDGAKSAIASATYTALTKSTIAEAQASENGTTVCIEGTVVASAANGAVIYDGTDYIYYYNTSNTLTAGQMVRMIGALSTYGGAKQMPNSSVITELGTEDVTHPTAVALDGAAFDAIQAAAVATRQFVTFIGTLTISGNYVNISIDGAESAVGSIVKPKEDLSELDGKKVLVEGYLMYVNNKYVYTIATDVQELKSELTNPDFEASAESNAIGIRTYARDIKGEEFAQMQAVDGWDIVENGDARAAGVFAYGSESFLGGEGYLAPTVPFDVNATNALGIVAVWSASLQYTQQVFLEAGKYLLQAPVFNAGGSGAVTKNLIGIDDTYATSTTFPVNAWTVENVELTLTEAKLVTISVGLTAANAGSGAMPHLFIEGVKLISGDQAIEDAKAAAEERVAVLNSLAKAQAVLDAAVVGDGLFCYPSSALETAKTAIDAATTVDALNEALSTLEAAQILPDPEKKYSFQLKDGGNYMTLNSGTKLAAEPTGLSFVAVDGGYAITDGTEYVACTGTGNNTWTMAASETAYAWTIAPLADGYYTIAKVSAAADHIGVDNTDAGSSCYANKAVSDKALWTIAEFTEVQPQTDYTNYIVNADLTGEGGFDATGTKGIDGSGIVKAANNAQFDFKQTIENLPAGKYKLTAKAAYRYSGSEEEEAAAIAAGTNTKLATLYATVGSKTTRQPVMNRFDGASDKDYANGNGSVTVNSKFVPNSSSAVKAWFDADQYINEVEFNLPEDGNVTIGIVKTAQPEAGDYTVIGPWTLERIGDAEEEPVNPVDLQPGDDATAFIVNPSFETGDLTGWTVGSSSDTGVKENSNATYHTEGCDGAYLFNTWWQGIPITQTIQGLPNGLYELKALMTNDSGVGNADKPCLYLTANGEHSEAVASGNAGVFVENSIQFYVTDGTAVIGAIGGNADGSFTESGYYWYKVDNFRLTYVSALPSIDEIDIPEGKMSLEAQSGIAAAQQAQDVIALIEAVKVAEASVAAYADAAKAIEAAKAIMEGTNVATEEATTTFADAISAIETAYDGGTLADTDAKAAGATLGTIVTEWRQGTEGAAVKFMESAYSLNAFDQPLYINTWSVEGESDGSEFKVPFYEYFVANDQTLAANSFSTTIEGLKPGIYDVTALIRVQPTNGQDTPSGVTFSANDGEAVDATAEATAYGDRLFLKEVATQATVGEDGKLVININVEEGSNAHWLSFKNVKYAAAPTDPYEDALAAIQDGANYRIFTEINGEKYYVTEGGLLSAIVDDGGIFTFTKVTGGTYKEYGFKIDSGTKRFTNPPLANNVANLTSGVFANSTGNRNDWEAQVLFLKDGKYAIRSCNVPDGTSSWNDAGRTYWTFAVEDVKPQYTYDPTYVWQLEGPLSIINVAYQLYEADGETTVGNPVTKKQEANSAVNIPSDFTNIAYYDYIVEGEIADVDCTIKVFRSMKNGVVHQLSDLSNEKSYTIRCNRGALLTSDDHLASTAHSSLTVAAPADFAIISYEDNYYLYSIADSKFVTFDSTLSPDGARGPLASMPTHGTDDALKLEPKTDPYFLTYFTAGGTNYGLNTNGNDPYGYVINTWMNADEGNQYYIIESGEFDPTDALAALDAYFHPSFFVTYVVKDAEGTTLFTSEPQPTMLNTQITELPSEYKRAFTDYSDIDVTITDAETTIEVTATSTFPFELSASFDEAKWYNMTIRTSYYVAKDETEPYYPTTDKDLDAPESQWAFTGDVYNGIVVFNKAAGEGWSLTKDGSNVVMREGAYAWTIGENSDGFTLKEIGTPNNCINQNGGSSGPLQFWNSAGALTDDGSTFRVTEVVVAEPVILNAPTWNVADGTQTEPNMLSADTPLLITYTADNVEENGYNPDDLKVKVTVLVSGDLPENMMSMGSQTAHRVMGESFYISLGETEFPVALKPGYVYQNIVVTAAQLVAKAETDEEEIIASYAGAPVQLHWIGKEEMADAQNALEEEIANAEGLIEESKNEELYDQDNTALADAITALQDAIEAAKAKLGTTDDEMTAATTALQEAEDAFKSVLTGIIGINAELLNGTIYDLSGRKVLKVQRGGVYIINGKKVAVK